MFRLRENVRNLAPDHQLDHAVLCQLGRIVCRNAAELTKDRVIELMVGREVSNIFPQSEHEFGEVALEVRGLSVYSTDGRNKKLVDDVSFSVRRGEVLG